jgi:hypothetical protein
MLQHRLLTCQHYQLLPIPLIITAAVTLEAMHPFLKAAIKRHYKLYRNIKPSEQK